MPTVDGNRISTVRKSAGLTQEDLAKKAYVSKKVISNIERGKTKTVNEYVLNLLSYSLLVRREYLTGESDDPNVNKNGLNQAVVIKPKWEFEYDIKNTFEKHSKTREVETLLQNIVYYLSQQEDGTHYNKYDGIRLLQEVVSLLQNENLRDIKMLIGIIKAIKDNHD
jgi:transcriptional regulator with XRE-family HTH domain